MCPYLEGSLLHVPVAGDVVVVVQVCWTEECGHAGDQMVGNGRNSLQIGRSLDEEGQSFGGQNPVLLVDDPGAATRGIRVVVVVVAAAAAVVVVVLG